MDIKIECGTWAMSHAIRGHLWRATVESDGRIYTASDDSPFVAIGEVIRRVTLKIHPLGDGLRIDRMQGYTRHRKRVRAKGGDAKPAGPTKPSRQLEIKHVTSESTGGGDPGTALHSGRGTEGE